MPHCSHQASATAAPQHELQPSGHQGEKPGGKGASPNQGEVAALQQGATTTGEGVCVCVRVCERLRAWLMRCALLALQQQGAAAAGACV